MSDTWGKEVDPGFEEFGDSELAEWMIRRQRYEDGRTLSRASVEQTVRSVDHFIMHRIDRIWKQTGVPPQEILVRVNIPSVATRREHLLTRRRQLLQALAETDLRLQNL